MGKATKHPPSKELAVSKASAVFNLMSQPQLSNRIISYCEPCTFRV